MSGILLLSTETLIARGADASAWDVAAWSGAAAALAVAATMALSPGPSLSEVARRDGATFYLSAALQTISAVAFIIGVKETAVANVVVITASAPALAAVFARVALGEKTPRRVWTATGVVMAGILTVVGGSVRSGGAVGEIAALVAVTAFALNVTLWRRHHSLSRPGVMGLAGALTAASCVAPATITGLDGGTIALLILMGALIGPVSRIGISSATRYLGAAEVALLTPIETVAASTGAWLLFDEIPAALTWLGGSVVIVAVIGGLYQRSEDG